MSIVQSLWIGNSFSVMEKLGASSFIKNDNEFHLYSYEKIEGIPEGVVIKDANEIISEDKIFKYKKYNTYSAFANLFRYKLLLEKGGYWVDMDIVSFKKFDYTDDYIFTQERISKKRLFGYNHQINNCIIKVPAGSEIMDYCYKEALKKNSDSLHWGQTGPELLTKAVYLFKMEEYITKPNRFYPIAWWEWKEFISENPKKNILNNSDAIHFYNEMWRREGVDKSADFPESSIYEQLKKKYLSIG